MKKGYDPTDEKVKANLSKKKKKSLKKGYKPNKKPIKSNELNADGSIERD